MVSNKYSAVHAGVVAVFVWVALVVLGGPSNDFDKWAVGALSAQRLAYPLLTHAGIWVSFAGSAPFTLGLTLLGATFLAWRGSLFRAAALLAIVLGGRLMVEILKQSIGRIRPDLEVAPVAVYSLSYPSGHAANSMVTFVAIVLFCVPERHRKVALTLAIAASLAVGVTRPLLGVHWPSDVLGGWIFGLLWAVGWWRILGASSLGLGTGGAAGPFFRARRQEARRQEMTPTPRDPAEQALIEDAENLPTSSQSDRAGGDTVRDVGPRDEIARSTGKDKGVTRVHKSEKPDEGDEPNLPNRS